MVVMGERWWFWWGWWWCEWKAWCPIWWAARRDGLLSPGHMFRDEVVSVDLNEDGSVDILDVILIVLIIQGE